ncbi:hypothetical protein [Nonomuraea sp. CA-141351]|uniref:hypothetical protein n=1 Tax=Nonomuraea sp. CA-141351 TaxID=3239996 RepID=UPI003D8AA5C6
MTSPAHRGHVRAPQGQDHGRPDRRQLVHRFEQLAEKTLDAQKRMAIDLAELHTRATLIEQILRTAG